MPTPTTVRIQREPFDAAAEAARLTRGCSDVGAVVSFTLPALAPQGHDPKGAP